MKVKRLKLFRRYVRFFKVNHDFREPFKVLCDGNFLHHLRRQNLTNAREIITRLLSGTVRVSVTRCVLSELKKLGKQFKETYRSALSFHLVGCKHRTCISASECLTSLVRDGNEEHFFVATQDEDLKSNLRQLPGVAILYGRLTAVMLEPPSDFQQQHAKSMEAERTKVSDKEMSVLKSQARKRRAMIEAQSDLPSKKPLISRGSIQREREEEGKEEGEEEGGDTGDGTGDGGDAKERGKGGEETERENEIGKGEEEGEDFESLRSLMFDKEEWRKRRGLDKEKDRPTFKKKYLKGPNPLSIKKKKKVSNSLQPQKPSEEKPKRKRLRKKKTEKNQS